MVKDRGSSVRLHRPQLQKRHEFVEHQARAQQVADRQRILPRHAHQPGDGREDNPENLLQRAGEASRARQRVRPAQNAVHHGDQRQKRDQHGRDVQRQMQAVARALRRRVDHVDARSFPLEYPLCRR